MLSFFPSLLLFYSRNTHSKQVAYQCGTTTKTKRVSKKCYKDHCYTVKVPKKCQGSKQECKDVTTPKTCKGSKHECKDVAVPKQCTGTKKECTDVKVCGAYWFF